MALAAAVAGEQQAQHVVGQERAVWGGGEMAHEGHQVNVGTKATQIMVAYSLFSPTLRGSWRWLSSA